MSGVSARAVRVGKILNSYISNEDNDTIRMIKLLENSSVLNDWVTETVKHEIKKLEDGFLTSLIAPIAASLISTMASSLISKTYLWK